MVWASLIAQLVKNLPAMHETQVQTLGGEDPLEKGMATHSNTLAWRIPWTKEPGRLQSMGSQRVTTERLTLFGIYSHSQVVLRGGLSLKMPKKIQMGMS